MRTKMLIAGVVVAAALGAMTVGFAGGGGRVKEAMTIRVVEHANTDKVIDVGKPGDSTGDILTWHNPVYDATNDHQVGRDQGECTRISPSHGLWECRWVTFLDAYGSITVEGSFNDANNTVLAITGGTGMMKNARGSMKLSFRKNPAEFGFEFNVVP